MRAARHFSSPRADGAVQLLLAPREDDDDDAAAVMVTTNDKPDE